MAQGFFAETENNKSGHNLKEKCHLSPSLDNEFKLVARIMQKCFLKIYFIVWPLAKCGSFFLWMMTSPPTWKNVFKK